MLLSFDQCLSYSDAFTDPLFLFGACGSIRLHWYQADSIITQNQFVDVAGVAHAARLNNVKSTNASFPLVFFQFSNYDPRVN